LEVSIYTQEVMHGGEDPLPMPFNETVKLYNIVSLHDSFRNELVELIMH